MTKTEMLFIRACKSGNPTLRVKSVYRRCYLSSSKEIHSVYIACILLGILEKYFKYNLSEIISYIAPEYQINLDHYSYYNKVIQAVINNIRFTEGSKLPKEFIPPIHFRR